MQQSPHPQFSSRPPRPPRFSRPPPHPSSRTPKSSAHPSSLLHPPPVVRRRPRHSDPYIPPFRRNRLQPAAPNSENTLSHTYQKRHWLSMKKRINGVVNRLNADNVSYCAKALLRVNLVRARGVLVKTLLRAQLASPDLSSVFACLIAVIGSRLPQVTELLVARLIAQWRAAYANQDRVLCFATARFTAHLFNQQVVTDLLVLELLATCLVEPNDGSTELAVVTVRECITQLSEKAPSALNSILEKLRRLLSDGKLSKRVQVLITDLIALRREKCDSVSVLDPRLDLLDDEDIITHLATLEDVEQHQPDLLYEINNFQFDPNFDENERVYESIKRDILGAEADESTPVSDNEHANSDQPQTSSGNNASVTADDSSHRVKITDMTEAQLVDFRRTVYLTISSGLSYEEWAHKLMNLMRSNPDRESELCQMIVDCCSQEKTFLRSHGLLGQRFCLLNRIYVLKFEELFATQYATIHRFDTRKIRNIGNFYASLFASDALPWSTMQLIRIVEKETTASSRIFLKILFQEIANTLGKTETKAHFSKGVEDGDLNGVFPTDNAENARFSINFFTSIGLGYLTDNLREKLKTLPNQSRDLDGDADASSSLSSSSLSSSSLSSSSLSESSGLEHSQGLHPVGSEGGSKRGLDESSFERSDRPNKTRRTDNSSVGPGENSIGDARSREGGFIRLHDVSRQLDRSESRQREDSTNYNARGSHGRDFAEDKCRNNEEERRTHYSEDRRDKRRLTSSRWQKRSERYNSDSENDHGDSIDRRRSRGAYNDAHNDFRKRSSTKRVERGRGSGRSRRDKGDVRYSSESEASGGGDYGNKRRRSRSNKPSRHREQSGDHALDDSDGSLSLRSRSRSPRTRGRYHQDRYRSGASYRRHMSSDSDSGGGR